jgi:hypothetical protein
VFIDITPVLLVGPFSGSLTAYKAKKLVADYMGKWVRWSVPVRDVSRLSNSVSVFAAVPSGGMWNISIHMGFAISQENRLLHLEKGATIEVEGKVSEVRTDFVDLTDCVLVGPEGSA